MQSMSSQLRKNPGDASSGDATSELTLEKKPRR